MEIDDLQRRYESSLAEFVQTVLDKFGERVVSIVLFGSVAKGTATKASDVDLLVVMSALPSDWRKRNNILGDIVLDFILNQGIRVFPLIVSPKAIEVSARAQNPLFYGILTGYRVLYDKDDFFEKNLEVVRHEIRRTQPIYVEGGKEWRLAEIV